MAEETALLHAILEEPDDDLPRLAYADWLEERGDSEQLARAEFIRTQIALSRMADDDPELPALTVREATLLNTLGEHWQADLQGVADKVVFRRGFLDEVSLTWPALLQHGERLLDRVPATLWQLHGKGHLDPRELASWPSLHRVRGLDLARLYVKLPGVRDLLRSSQVTGLRRLHLGRMRLGETVGSCLRAAESLTSLRELRLADLPLGDQGLGNLFEAPWFANLTSLALFGCRLTPAILERLLDRWPPGLTHLDLSFVVLDDEGVRALARFASGSSGSRLKELSLNNASLSAAGFATLLHSSFVEGLTALDVRGVRCRESRVRLLADAPLLCGLTRLGVTFDYDNGNAELLCLLNAPHLRRLTRLDLSTSGIGAEGAAALATSAVAANLTHVDLSINNLGEPGVLALAKSAQLRRLTHLNLRSTNLHTDAVCKLADSPILANVVELDLGGIHIADRAAQALANSPHVGAHTVLIFHKPKIGRQLSRARFPGRIEIR